jgi:hypothetical protein
MTDVVTDCAFPLVCAAGMILLATAALTMSVVIIRLGWWFVRMWR